MHRQTEFTQLRKNVWREIPMCIDVIILKRSDVSYPSFSLLCMLPLDVLCAVFFLTLRFDQLFSSHCALHSDILHCHKFH